MQKPDIVDVIGNEIHVKQKGRRLWGLCPFHSEKTPSFSINSEMQTFYCFGCHEHGDVIHFVMKLRGMTFKDAIKALGITQTSSPFPPPEGDKRRKLVEGFHAWCRQYRHECLELIEVVERIEHAIDDPAYLSLESVAGAFDARFVAQYHVWLLTGSFDTEEAMGIYKERHG